MDSGGAVSREGALKGSWLGVWSGWQRRKVRQATALHPWLQRWKLHGRRQAMPSRPWLDTGK